jgi:acyl carrier protein
MTGHLDHTDRTRLVRAGVAAMPTGQGLALFDAAVAAGRPVVVPARFDAAALCAQPNAPAVLRELIRTTRRTAEATTASHPSSLARRLVGLAEVEQDDLLLGLVRTTVADVLGHAGPATVEEHRGFLDMGIDSLTALELRDHLSRATGLELPTTLVFDYPTPVALAGHLRPAIMRDATAGSESIFAELDRLEAMFSANSPDEATRTRLAARLQDFLSKCHPGGTASRTPGEDDEDRVAPGGFVDTIESASHDEIFDFIDTELGTAGGAGELAPPRPHAPGLPA